MVKILKRTMVLFLFLALNPITALASETPKLYPSGNVVSIYLKLENPIVRSVLYEGKHKLKKEDAIVCIEYKDKKINSVEEIHQLMKIENEKIKIQVIRENKEKTINTKTKELRAFIFSDVMQGTGTVTAIDSNGNYVGIAHSICNNQAIGGVVYEAGYIQNIKSEEGKPGQLVANGSDNLLGTIESTGDYGIKGKFNNHKANESDYLEVAAPKAGKAYIYCETPITNEMKMHEIEIIEVGDTHSSIVIKDESLINERGGGVRGMSGSPIIQDNKIVGGFSYGEKADSTRGGFLNIDNMITK